MSAVVLNRDEVLADFQACTGIQDVEVAIVHLEDSDWDLVKAINNVLPQHTQTLPSERTVAPVPPETNERTSHEDQMPIAAAMGLFDPFGRSTTSSSSNTADRFPKPLQGNSRDAGPSSRPLVSVSADLMSPGASGGGGSCKEIRFVIRNNGGKSLTLSLAECETIDTLKTLIHAHFEIPPCQQRLIGWPIGDIPADSTKLGSLNLPPEVNLALNGSNAGMTSLRERNDTEDYVVPEANTTPQKFLIPDNTPDETVGTMQFSDNFFARYGSCHPMFFHGTLEDGTKEACVKSAKQRKQLAIYVHHDGSVMSNVFCQQILCNESIVSYLTNNFVVWGWDVTNESNRQMLLSAMSTNFGAPGKGTIRSIDRDRYPVLIIVSRVRSATEITSVIYGSSVATVDELMGNLMYSSELYQTQRQSEIREEDEREARETLKREQDEAYEESLQADRAKDEAKRAVEQQKRTEEMERQSTAEQTQKLREEIAKTLPPEPENDCTDPVCSLKCRLPGGKIVSRRFLQSTTLGVLFNYLYTQGFSRDEFRFLTTYPKRDLTGLPETTVMKDVFSSQDTLIVEQR